jgi:hypothetical protein
MTAIKRGDVVHFEDREWEVSGTSHGPDGLRLVLVSGDESVRARPADCQLVGRQLTLTEERSA